MDLNTSSLKNAVLERKFDFFKKNPLVAKLTIPRLEVGYSCVLTILMLVSDKLGYAYSDSQIVPALNLLSLVSGFAFGVKATLIFKKWNESEGESSLMPAIVFILLILLLVGVESFLSIGNASVGGVMTLEGY